MRESYEVKRGDWVEKEQLPAADRSPANRLALGRVAVKGADDIKGAPRLAASRTTVAADSVDRTATARQLGRTAVQASTENRGR